MLSLRYRCPVCRGIFEVAPEMAGGMVRCGHCGIQVNPEAMPELQVMGEGGTSADAGNSPEEVIRRLLLKKESCLRKLRKEGKPPMVRPQGEDSRRARGRALRAAGGAIAAGGVVCLLAGGPIPAAVGALAISLLLLAVGAIQWLEARKVPAFDHRETPLLGVKAFASALNFGQFEYARCCLAPGNDESQESFNAYWLPRIYPVRGVRHAVSGLKIKQATDDLALASVFLEITVCHGSGGTAGALLHLATGSLWALVAAKMAETEEGHSLLLTKLLRRVDGQWCVVNPKACGPEDGAFDEAVRIARLSDAGLAAEAANCAAEA